MASFDAGAWQASWDRQQATYMPDREHRFAAMLDVVAAAHPDGGARRPGSGGRHRLYLAAHP